jgi:hypothetical protein
MDMTLTTPSPASAPRFGRDPLDLERAARLRAERVASDLARLVAHEGRRAEDERERRIEAESVAKGMVALVAHENARAQRAERRLRELLQD